LVRFVNPTLNDEEVAEILKKRFELVEPEVSTLLVEGVNIDLAAELFDPGDADDLHAEVEKLKKKIAAARPSSTAAGASSSTGGVGGAPGAASSSSGTGAGAAAALPRPKLPNPAGPSGYGVEEVQSFMPRIPGCTATREIKWHSRWRARYPCAMPATSKSWGGAIPETAAIRYILEWAWQRHADAGGGECPWDLSAL
jgi:hypothetical protein